MIRKQIYLDPDDEDRIKQLSQRMGASESELIRKAIREFLNKSSDRNKQPLDNLVGQSDLDIESGSTDHDRYLNEGRFTAKTSEGDSA